MKRYKVLWVDDQPTEEFLNEAYEQGLDIIVTTNHEEGVAKLQSYTELWDAIILDVNCKKTANDANESAKSFTETKSYMDKYYSGCNLIPWFVYTGGTYEGRESLEFLIQDDRSWDDRKYYNKPADMNILFENIKRAADNVDTTKIKHKYADIFSIDSAICGDLMGILATIEAGIITDANMLNAVRKVLEWLRGEFKDLELLPQSVTELNGFSRYVCENLAPISIQRSLHSAIVVSQEGSHRLTIDEEIRSGLAPYILRSTSYELLNVLLWAGRLFADNTEIERIKQLAIDKDAANHSEDDQLQTTDKVIHYEGIVVKDDNDNICCGEYLLSFKCEHLVGKSIQIIERSENTNYRTKHLYRHFVRKYEIK